MSDVDTEAARIVKTPEVLHGQARFDGTRIGVFMIADMIRDGDWTAREVAEEYPDLSRADVDAALAYYDDHPEELARWREAREVAIAGLRERSRRPSDPNDDDADTEA
jgi:uncharacterized protein (DUF433 family)